MLCEVICMNTFAASNTTVRYCFLTCYLQHDFNIYFSKCITDCNILKFINIYFSKCTTDYIILKFINIYFSKCTTDCIILKFEVLKFHMLIFLNLYIAHGCLQTKQRQHNYLMINSCPVFSRIFLHASWRPFNCNILSCQ